MYFISKFYHHLVEYKDLLSFRDFRIIAQFGFFFFCILVGYICPSSIY